MNTVAVDCAAPAEHTLRRGQVGVPKGVRKSASLILIAALFISGSAVAVLCGVPIKQVMKNYSYDVLIILIMMELFTNLIAETGLMQRLAVRLAELSQGKKSLCLTMFGGMMFLISSCLNNITAVMMILPVVFVLLKTLDANRRYVYLFFAALLALSNTGGAASPVGDFPAIVIMTSGITSFLSYLTHAFPLFAFTSVVLLAVWGAAVRGTDGDRGMRRLAVANLKSQYKNSAVRVDALGWLGAVFGGMFLAWSFIPQDMIPPEIIAVLGYAAAMAVCSVKGLKVKQQMDLKPVLTIASFLFLAQVIGQMGILNVVAASLRSGIKEPKLLVMAIMVITSLVAGVFGAGPAAAAMMPVITELCSGPLQAQSDWIAVAYAAAICAGSSLFMWSASAGFILSGKIEETGLEDEYGGKISWGVKHYFKYGVINYIVQMSIALLAVAIIL